MSNVYDYANPTFIGDEYKQGKNAEEFEMIYLKQHGMTVKNESLEKKAKGDIAFSKGNKVFHDEVKSSKRDGVLYFNIVECYYHYDSLKGIGSYDEADKIPYSEHHSNNGWFPTEEADYLTYWVNMGSADKDYRRIMMRTNEIKAIIFDELKEITNVDFSDLETYMNTFMNDRYAALLKPYTGSKFCDGNFWITLMPEKYDKDGYLEQETGGRYAGQYVRHNVYQVAITIEYLEQLLDKAGFTYTDKRVMKGE